VVLEIPIRSDTSEIFIISLGGLGGVLGGRESLIVAEAYENRPR
jgi:hypothetical protein